MDLNRVSK